MSKKAALSSKGIKYRLVIAVCLMSVIPILICLNFIFPSLFITFIAKINLYTIVILMIFISILGFVIIKQIIDPIAKLSQDAKSIVNGDVGRHIEIQGEDEVGQIGYALNQLTVRIKENMDELREYGNRTAQINIDIQKRVIVLSGLLQISSLISQGARLDDVLHLCIEKVRGLADSTLGFLLFLEDGKFKVRAQDVSGEEPQIEVNFSEHDEFLIQMFKKHTPSVLDTKNPNNNFLKFATSLGIKNCICIPIFSRQKHMGILGIGNRVLDYVYSNDDFGLLDIFAKQITIAIENDMLTRRVEKLEIKDALTGLFNEQFIHNRLSEEIKRAIIYQRPCSFVLASINNFRDYQNSYGLIVSEAAIKRIAVCLNGSFSEIDKVGRFGDCEFSILLPEKNKRQARKIAEEVQNKITELFKNEPDPDKRLTISVSVAENPLDGSTAEELIAYAVTAINKK